MGVVEGECQQQGGVLVRAKPVVVMHMYVWCAAWANEGTPKDDSDEMDESVGETRPE